MAVIFTAKDLDDIYAEVEDAYNKLRDAKYDKVVFIGIFHGSLEYATEFGLYFASEVACFNNMALSSEAVISFHPRRISKLHCGDYETEIFIAAYRPVKDPQ